MIFRVTFHSEKVGQVTVFVRSTGWAGIEALGREKIAADGHAVYGPWTYVSADRAA